MSIPIVDIFRSRIPFIQNKYNYSNHNILDKDTNKLLFWHYDKYLMNKLRKDEVLSLSVWERNELEVF